MNTYLVLKYLHILSATILFGTGIGIAFFKWVTDCSGDVRAIRIVTERVVWADWLFTTPAVILQPMTGLILVYLAGYSLTTGWIIYTVGLYLFAGCCWVPVVWLQICMRDMARVADVQNTPLPPAYWKYTRIWFWLGVPAFGALIVVYWLMVFKPKCGI
jgi:uncharacterized membrane protein